VSNQLEPEMSGSVVLMRSQLCSLGSPRPAIEALQRLNANERERPVAVGEPLLRRPCSQSLFKDVSTANRWRPVVRVGEAAEVVKVVVPSIL